MELDVKKSYKHESVRTIILVVIKQVLELSVEDLQMTFDEHLLADAR